MSHAGNIRSRTSRTSARLTRHRGSALWNAVRDPAVLKRLVLVVSAAVAVWFLAPSVRPPFPYRIGYVVPRDVPSRLAFRVLDEPGTENARAAARRNVFCVYEQDAEPIVQLRAQLQLQVAQIATAAAIDRAVLDLWTSFLPKMEPGTQPTPDDEVERQLDLFRGALKAEAAVMQFNEALGEAFRPLEQQGMLVELEHTPDEGNQLEVFVFPKGGDPATRQLLKVSDVLVGEATNGLYQRIRERLGTETLPEHIIHWLRRKLEPPVVTLKLNLEQTERLRKEAVENTEPVYLPYLQGQSLVRAGTTLGVKEIELLEREHAAYLATLTGAELLYRGAASGLLIAGLFVLCGAYLERFERRFLERSRSLVNLLCLVVATVAVTRLTLNHADGDSLPVWYADLLPTLLFGTLVSVAYSQQISLVLSGALLLLLVLVFGHSAGHAVVCAASIITIVLMLDRIRSRSKLVVAGICSGLVALVLTGVVGLLDGQPLSQHLAVEAGRNFLWPLAAAFLITGLLPFIEKLFHVVTEISLLELGDVAHPLLQELVRRAPGTYNHSINVATLAEAAAESIGASGLLVRVGAYYHDIGKMLKPGYFVENQGEGVNRHDSLLPAMSTLIIIAHVKDGADLARQHHLPEPIIDFIEQHHGTTLVQYFYDRASQQSEQEPDGGEVDENRFRYPGPKPQSKEAAVLMLADAVEGACRTLVEPAPKRIETVVRKISRARLLDGQFDECGLNLRELSLVENSLIKTLVSIHHGRIVYPNQEAV